MRFRSFPASAQPHYLGKGHLDQPGRYEGSIRLRGESFKVDSYGFRDRSWGKRSQFGPGMVPKGAAYGGYTYGTASAAHAFHCISGDRGAGCLGYHGYLIEDGVWAPLAEARREVRLRGEAVTRARIEFSADGHRRAVHIDGQLTQEVEGIPSLSAPGQCLAIDNTLHPANPRLNLALAVKNFIRSFGIEWDAPPRKTNGHFAPFSWAGAAS